MSTALYRRYRPDSFEDVIGQEHVTRALETALSTSRIAHAYLFSGPRGCGKTTSARILARSLNCVEGPTPTPCGSCESCIELASGGPGTLDVVEIDAASHRGVNDARDLRERLTFAPTRDRFRIFILDEAHMVTNEGFNVLLKAVEEPPPHVKFIFATTEPDKVLPTIRSRTHHYPFRLVPPNVLVPFLKAIGEREGVNLDDSVVSLVVRAGGGSVRDSLSVLDQLIAGSQGEVTPEHAVRLLGYTDSALLDRVIDALGENDGAAVFDQVGELIEAGVDPHQFIEDLLQRLRDLLVCSLAGDRAEDILAGVPADQYAIMRRQASQWGTGRLSRRADVVEEAAREMAGATAPRLQLELLLARLLVEEVGVAGHSPSLDAAREAAPVRRSPEPVTTRPEEPKAATVPEPEPQGAQVRAPESVPSQVSKPAPTAVSEESSAPSKDEVRQQWGALLGVLGQSSAMLPSLMQAVRDVSAEGDTVVFSMREQMDVERFQRAGGEDRLSEALTGIFNRPLKGIARVVGEEPGPAHVAESQTGRTSENKANGEPTEPSGRSPAGDLAPAPVDQTPSSPNTEDDVPPEEPPAPDYWESGSQEDADSAAPASSPRSPTRPRAAAQSEPETAAEQPVEAAKDNNDNYAQYRGRQPVDLVTDILGGQVIEEVLEEPEEE